MKNSYGNKQAGVAPVIIIIVIFLIIIGGYYLLSKNNQIVNDVEVEEREIKIDIISCDFNNKKIEAISWDEQKSPLEILITDDTKFYRTTSGVKDNFTFEDYCSMVLNSSYSWPDYVKGSERFENTIEASDIFMIAQ